MEGLHVARWGNGPPLMLVHGSVRNGEMTWGEQRPLADRWTLVVPDRRGYFPNHPVDREDFDVDAGDIDALLGDGMHVVGHSYGAVVSLLAAARRPEAVLSLCVIEPPAFGVARGIPDVERIVSVMRDLVANGPRDPAGFLRVFLKQAGSTAQLPDPLPPPLEQNARLLMNARDPTEADIPLDLLRDAAFPKLVVSGAHSSAFDAVCDVLEERLEAERAVVPGAGHSVPQTGAAFNEVLESFLNGA